MDVINFKVSSDGKNLEIWVRIPDELGYEDLEIDKIAIQDHLHYTVGYPEKPQMELTINGVEPFAITDTKQVITSISFSDISKATALQNTGMFFMYAHQRGIPDPGIPCEGSREYVVAATVNMLPIYNTITKLFTQMSGNCTDSDIRDQLIDLSWKKDTFKQAITLEEYGTAAKLYEDIISMDVKAGDCLNACGSMSTNYPKTKRSGGCKNC